MKNVFLSIIALFFFATMPVQAQTTTTTTVTPPQITTIMDGITADVGVGWDIGNKSWVQTDTVRFLEYANTSNTGKYSAFLNFVGNVDPRISLGYSTANKLVGGGAFNLFIPSKWGITSPLLKAVGISPFAQYEFAHMGNVESQE